MNTWLLILTTFVTADTNRPANVESFRVLVSSQEECHLVAKTHTLKMTSLTVPRSTVLVVHSCTPLKGQVKI